MPLFLIRKDITEFPADAVVNAANESLLGGGGVDGAIHRAAGPELLEECRGLGGCRPGEAKITRAYRLPARYIIHTVGPRWRGGGSGEEAVLRACYRNSLRLAAKMGCETVVFPLISSGIFGYPRAEALQAAEEEIRRFLEGEEMTVYLTVLGRFLLPAEMEYPELTDLARREPELRPRRLSGGPLSFSKARKAASPAFPAGGAAAGPDVSASVPMGNAAPARAQKDAAPALPEEELCAAELPAGLTEALSDLDESFSRMLLRKITEKGLTDAQCYKKANVDRKLFSKIRSDAHYRPSKATALAFAVALELSPGETEELLRKAGFALSPASTFDVIVRFFILRGDYNVLRINEALFAYDQPLLGNVG